MFHVAAQAWDIRGARAAGTAGAYINRYDIHYVDPDGSQAGPGSARFGGIARRANPDLESQKNQDPGGRGCGRMCPV